MVAHPLFHDLPEEDFNKAINSVNNVTSPDRGLMMTTRGDRPPFTKAFGQMRKPKDLPQHEWVKHCSVVDHMLHMRNFTGRILKHTRDLIVRKVSPSVVKRVAAVHAPVLITLRYLCRRYLLKPADWPADE